MVKDREGVVRYKGELIGKKGVFYGIEVVSGSGKHSGMYKDVKYFEV